MNAEWWNPVFQWGSVALVLATFFCGAGAVWSGSRINARQAERLVGLETELARAQTALAEQQTRAAEAERRLLEIQIRLRPRALTVSQQSAVTSEMAKLAVLPHTERHQRAAVFSTSATFESAALAEQIAAALVAAGWDVSRQSVTFGKPLTVSGVGVLTSSNQRGIDVARALVEVLASQAVFAFVIPEKRSGCEDMPTVSPEGIAADPWCSQISVLVGDHP